MAFAVMHDRLGTPVCLYKYLPRRYAEALVDGSSIRIGTMHEFRAMEDSDPRRGDREEGIFTHCEYMARAGAEAGGYRLVRREYYGVPEDSGITLQNLTVKETVAHRDAYMFCTSMDIAPANVHAEIQSTGLSCLGYRSPPI